MRRSEINRIDPDHVPHRRAWAKRECNPLAPSIQGSDAATVQHLFDPRRGRHALQRSYRCFAPIRFLDVVARLHRRFWLPAGHGLMRRRAVHVLPPIGILWRGEVSLLLLTPPGGAAGLFFLSAHEKRNPTNLPEARQCTP